MPKFVHLCTNKYINKYIKNQRIKNLHKSKRRLYQSNTVFFSTNFNLILAVEFAFWNIFAFSDIFCFGGFFVLSLLCNFEKLREPVRLVVVLDGDAAGVEENEQDDRPVEGLLLHHPTDDISEKDESGDETAVKPYPLLDPGNGLVPATCPPPRRTATLPSTCLVLS